MKLLLSALVLALSLTACEKKDSAPEPPAKTTTPAVEAKAPKAEAPKIEAAKVEAAKVEAPKPPELTDPPGGAEPAPGAPEMDEALAATTVKLMEELGATVEKNKGDCDKMGTEISAFLDKNAETYKKVKSAAPSAARNAAMEAKYGEKLKAATMKLMGGLMACQANANVAAAMKKM